MLDVAIIGAGLMGRWHLATARSLGARVVAIVDRDMRAAQVLSKQAPVARLGTDLGILRGLSVRVAHVCTPTAAHAQTAIALAESGIHALVEKPLAANADTTKSVMEAAHRNGVHICPVHQYAFQPGVERALSALRVLGPLHRIDFNICSAGADGGSITPDELVDEILPHPISILQRIMPGAPVSRLAWTMLRPRSGELLATAMHEGVVISIFVSAHARPTRMSTVLQCRSGAVEINGFHGYAVARPGKVSRGAKIGAPFFDSLHTLTAASSNLAVRAVGREPAYSGLRDLTRLFFAAATGSDNTSPPIDPMTILEGAAARDVLMASCKNPGQHRAS